MVKRRFKSNRGIALLATLLAIALMTLLVVDFTTTAALNYREAANQADEVRAYCLARSGVEAGIAILGQQALAQQAGAPVYDALNQPWAQPIPPIPLGGGTVSVSIVDEARKLDINQLYNLRTRSVNPQFEVELARLFTNIGVSTKLIPVIVDWLDPDSVESPGGAEADYYMRLMPPYQPRNGPMPTIGDLRMLKGVDDSTFMLLSHFLTVMPEPQVNINTAPPEVIAALAPQLANNPELVKEIVAAREQQPFVTLTQFGNLPGVGQFASKLDPLLTTHSTYFTITGEGDFAGARERVYAVIRNNPNGTAVLISWHED